MSTVSIGLNADHGYVILAAASVGFLNLFQAINVGQQRKKAGIKYPQHYAEKSEMENNTAAKVFNCLQRAHGNTLEHAHIILVCLLINGIFLPRVASGITGIWVLSRILYTLGYKTGNPASRERGGFGIFAALASIGLTVYNGVQLVMSAN